jgi:hypothetical protein
MRDTYSDLEPDTLQPSTLQPQTLRRVDDEGTRLMTAKHGSKSSTRSRAAERIVPSPFPTPLHPIRPRAISVVPNHEAHAMGAMRPQAPSEPTWLRPSQNIKLPATPTARVFKPFPDFDFSEFEDEEASDQHPVVHNYRTIAERLANPMTQADAQLCWEHAQQQQPQMELQYAQTLMAVQGFPLESGVRPITVLPKRPDAGLARISGARAIGSFLIAMILGATATASWNGDINEKEVGHVATQTQVIFQHLAYGSTTSATRARIPRWK